MKRNFQCCFRVVELLCSGSLVILNSSNKRRIGTTALIRGQRLLTFLSQMRRLFEHSTYSSRYINDKGKMVNQCGLFFFLADKATVDLLFSFLPTFNTVVVSPSLSLNEAVPGPVLANR